MSCIAGAIMYCTAAITIPGPLQSAPSHYGQSWAYAAYSVPILTQQGGVALPAYANPHPNIIPTVGAAGTYGARRT